MFVGNWLAMPRKKCLLSNRCPVVWKWQHVYWRASLTPKCKWWTRAQLNTSKKLSFLGGSWQHLAPWLRTSRKACWSCEAAKVPARKILETQCSFSEKWKKNKVRGSVTPVLLKLQTHHLKVLLSGSKVAGRFNGWFTSPSYTNYLLEWCQTSEKNSLASMKTPPISP